MAQEQQDVETLKRRGRRRLVGAVALVLAAVIVLPMVFDPEPRGTGSTLSVRIPAEDETPFAPKLPAKKAQTSPKEEYVVQVGAFANPQGVIAKLQSAKMPYYTELVHNNLTRVRAGPFPTREAAEQAREQLKALGFAPGAIGSKSG
jgi:DedD protein